MPDHIRPSSIPPSSVGPGKGAGPGRGMGASSVGPGRGMGEKGVRPQATGPKKGGRKSSAVNPLKGGNAMGGPSMKGPMLERGGKSAFSAQKPGKDPSMLPKGHGVFGRTPNVEKDGDPFTKRSPNKKPGNNSFF